MKTLRFVYMYGLSEWNPHCIQLAPPCPHPPSNSEVCVVFLQLYSMDISAVHFMLCETMTRRQRHIRLCRPFTSPTYKWGTRKIITQHPIRNCFPEERDEKNLLCHLGDTKWCERDQSADRAKLEWQHVRVHIQLGPNTAANSGGKNSHFPSFVGWLSFPVYVVLKFKMTHLAMLDCAIMNFGAIGLGGNQMACNRRNLDEIPHCTKFGIYRTCV